MLFNWNQLLPARLDGHSHASPRTNPHHPPHSFASNKHSSKRTKNKPHKSIKTGCEFTRLITCSPSSIDTSKLDSYPLMIFTQFLSSLNASTHTTRFSSHIILSNEYTTVGKSALTRFSTSDKIGRFSTDNSFIGRLYDTATRYCVFDCSNRACAACATTSIRLSSFLSGKRGNQSVLVDVVARFPGDLGFRPTLRALQLAIMLKGAV